MLAHKSTICARLVGDGSSLQRSSWLGLLMQLHLAESLGGTGTSKMVHSHVGYLSWSDWSGWRWLFLSLSLSLFMSIIILQAFHMGAGSQEGKNQSFQPRPRSLTTQLQPHSVSQSKSWGQEGLEGRGNRPQDLMEGVAGHSEMRSVGSHLCRQSATVCRTTM